MPRLWCVPLVCESGPCSSRTSSAPIDFGDGHHGDRDCHADVVGGYLDCRHDYVHAAQYFHHGTPSCWFHSLTPETDSSITPALQSTTSTTSSASTTSSTSSTPSTSSTSSTSQATTITSTTTIPYSSDTSSSSSVPTQTADSSSSSSGGSSTNVGAIAGGVVGGVAALAIAGVLLWCAFGRKRRRDRANSRDWGNDAWDPAGGGLSSSPSKISRGGGGSQMRHAGNGAATATSAAIAGGAAAAAAGAGAAHRRPSRKPVPSVGSAFNRRSRWGAPAEQQFDYYANAAPPTEAHEAQPSDWAGAQDGTVEADDLPEPSGVHGGNMAGLGAGAGAGAAAGAAGIAGLGALGRSSSTPAQPHGASRTRATMNSLADDAYGGMNQGGYAAAHRMLSSGAPRQQQHQRGGKDAALPPVPPQSAVPSHLQRTSSFGPTGQGAGTAMPSSSGPSAPPFIPYSPQGQQGPRASGERTWSSPPTSPLARGESLRPPEKGRFDQRGGVSNTGEGWTSPAPSYQSIPALGAVRALSPDGTQDVRAHGPLRVMNPGDQDSARGSPVPGKR